MTTPIPGVRRERETWIDAGKGLAIALVVLFHASIFLNDVGLGGPWPKVMTLADGVRMGLFFGLSGLFAAAATKQPWSCLLRGRVATFLWLYAAWSVIWVAVLTTTGWTPAGRTVPAWSDLPLLLVQPNASTWFFYGLAVYFAAAKALGSLPPWAQLAIVTSLSLAATSGALPLSDPTVLKMATYFVFFLTACLLSTEIRQGLNQCSVPRTLGIALAWALLTCLTMQTSGDFAGLRLATAIAGVLTVLLAVRAACDLPVVAPLTWLGARTLPIYVWHFYPVLGVVALAELSIFGGGPASVTSLLVAPTLAALAVVLSLVLYRATRNVTGLYAKPGWLVRHRIKVDESGVTQPTLPSQTASAT